MSAEEYFRSIGINSFQPGFYDEPAFVAKEAETPRILELYAEYVLEQRYSKKYLRHARHVITHTCEFLYGRLAKDGRKGACCDLSLTLNRMLDRLGIWNYLVKGCLSIYFNAASNRNSVHFALVSDQKHRTAPAPHAWVVAPPFYVVDVTVKHQVYPNHEERFLPEFILEDTVRQVETSVSDWFEAPVLAALKAFYGRSMTMMDARHFAGEQALTNSERFGAYEVKTQHACLKYIAVGICACAKPLDEIKSLCLSGDFPSALYPQLVGYLAQARAASP